MSSRPWRDGRESSAAARAAPASGPLIPTKAVGATTQRLVATALFFLLQGVKLGASKTVASFLLFSALDAAFVYLLPVFAIPRFNFKTWVVQIQILMLIVLNYSVFISTEWLWNGLWLMIKPALGFIGIRGYTATQLGTHESGLIRGKYVVDILPEASAKLDVIAPLCIHPQRKDPVYLQLSLDNTWPSAVKLSRAELGNTSQFAPLEFKKQDVAKFPADRKQKHMYIPITDAGAYYLDRITDDRTGLRVKVHRSRVVIPPCPSVDLISLSDDLLCHDSEFKAEIQATGVTPLFVFVDNEWVRLGEQLPDDRVATVKREVSKLNAAAVSVTKVKDRLGSEIKADKRVSAKRIRAPVADFPRHQRLANTNGEVTAQVHVSGENDDAPFTVSLAGPDGDNDLMELTVKEAGLHYVQVSRSGKYSLKSVRGRRCAGSASGTFEVFVPPPVSLDVQFNVVEDKCAGPMGIDANLKLHGSAPFRIGYRTIKGKKVVSERVADIQSNRGIVQFRPKDVGEYRYEISFVEDSYRRLDLASADAATYTISQRITELPGAQFVPLKTKTICGTSEVPMEVLVRGRGPFNLKYSVDDEHEYNIATGETTDQDKVRLNLNLPRGRHFVRLVSLTDRNGCVTDLHGTRTPDIYVQPQLAHIQWKSPSDLKSAEPVNVSLALAADNLNYPAKLVYEHVYSNSKTRHEVQLHSPDDVVRALRPGSYRLISLDDGVCGGEADTQTTINIGLYERPRLEVATADIPSSICQNLNAPPRGQQAKVHLYGEPPFTLVHEVMDPTGKVDTRTEKLDSHELDLPLDSKVVGQYKHFLWIMDSRYPEFLRPRYTSFTHEVYPLAEAVFANAKHRQKLHVCENTQLSQQIPVALKGLAPFQLTLQVGSEIKVLDVEKASNLDLRQYLGPFTQSGTRKVKLLSITDARGCKSQPNSFSPLTHELEIDVLPQPNLPAPSKLDYCIGDKISFQVSSVSSTGPQKLHVDYLWGQKRHRGSVPERSRVFEKYASQVGNLSVLAVTDSNGCETKFSEPQVVARVHPHPESKITEQPHFSIYEGDQISLGFAFKGVAPFSFKYTRSVNGVLKEVKEVKNIMEHEYNIIVDEGGEYEIIELRDKYCRTER